MTFLFYFDCMNHICFNGKFIGEDDSVFTGSNRSYRYGDGLFETFRNQNGKPILLDFHFERLFSSLQLLKIQVPAFFSNKSIENEIAVLCKKNNSLDSARIRLSVSRGNGGLYNCDNKFQYLIECWPLENSVSSINENGLVIDIYPDAKKSTDKFSNLKSANFLPYVMAAHWAKDHKLNEALLLNTNERICDATTANVFLIKDGKIYTPPLSEGCVAGVIRRFLIENLPLAGYSVKEMELGPENLELADEVFLTNAVHGLKWVKQFREKKYGLNISAEIYNKLIKSLF